MPKHYPSLNPHKALIWRIVHRDNLPWILAHGLRAGSSRHRAPRWINIGNEELIERRAQRIVPIAPGGRLCDYVPFYFTPFSPMMYNIHTGRGGVHQRSNDEIIILVSSLHRVAAAGLPFVFTDRHAYAMTANYFNDLAELPQVDWPLLQQRNFQRNPDDPAQIERYQAEALIHNHMPIATLFGVVCFTKALKSTLQLQVQAAGARLEVHHRPDWYF